MRTRTGFSLVLVAIAVALALYYETRPAPSRTPPTPRAPPAATPAAASTKPEVTHFRVGHRNVKSIYADAAAVWVATTDGLVRYEFATEKHEFFDRSHGLPSSSVFFVGRVDGRVLAGTASGQLAAFDERSRRWSPLTQVAARGAVLDIIQSRAGDLWIAHLAGVTQVPAGAIGDRARWIEHTSHSTQGGLPAQPVYGVAEGRQGELWFATEAGVARLQDTGWRQWPLDERPARVVTIKVDARGVVWAGTWGGGLRRFDGSSWKAYTTAQGLPGNYVLALHAERAGKLWIGTERGAARMSSGKLEKPLRAADGLLGEKVFALATSRDGSLWIGSFGGVARIRPAGSL